MAEADDDTGSSEQCRQSPSGFHEEYESLSDHDEVGNNTPTMRSSSVNVNPFATGDIGQKHSRPRVETVSSPPRSSSSSSPVTVGSSRNTTGNLSPAFDPWTSATALETGISGNAKSSSPREQQQQERPLQSLLDEGEEEEEDPSSRMGLILPDVRMTRNNTSTGGMAGFLEMESEPPRPLYPAMAQNQQQHQQARQILEDQEDLIDFTPADEPIQTSSGLYLTHRRSSAENRAKSSHTNTTHSSRQSEFPASYRPSPNRFEVEQTSLWGSSSNSHSSRGFGRAPASLSQARRMLSMAKVWVLFFCVVLVLGTAVILHAFRHEDAGVAKQKHGGQNRIETTTSSINGQQVGDGPQQILLLPLNNAAEIARQQREYEKGQPDNNEQRGTRRLLSHTSSQHHHHLLGDGLRQEFEDWIQKHGKVYSSVNEKEHRFGVWRTNHFRTVEKNERHGNCRLMKKPVFGSNHLKDLTNEEFQQQFLTGYNGVNADGHEIMTGRKRNLKAEHSPPVMHRDLKVTRHPSIQQRLLEEWKNTGYAISTSSCTWYDVSCWMRVIFNEYLYIGAGTMEPIYDADTYPTALDWRDLGAVSDVRRQGDCGACWAITAVETVESAYFIGTGSLLSLSESEVISCTDTCNMCYGGWPQDGYDYVMEHNGIPLSNDWSYDGDTLLALTQELESEDGEMDADLFASFINENCPASQGSGDQNGGDSGNRYGNIKGYGYCTERCVCYSDGSGCECDNQNESMAVRNVASYGPAAVCLDASTWQDYEGGILTSSSGCSSEFLAMNHCVQVVGYAYDDGSDGDNENSGSGSGDSGSKDNGNRQGYWIVRNQWSSNWGMNGYAYVAMGDNTCGILNDMTQAYL